MIKRHSRWIWLALALVHLGFVASAYFDLPLPQMLFFYGELTGSQAVYGLFSGKVPAQVRLRIETQSKNREQRSFDLASIAIGGDGVRRIRNLVSKSVHNPAVNRPVPSAPFNRKFLGLLAQTSLELQPEVNSVTVYSEQLSPPSFTSSESASWSLIDDLRVSR